MRAKNGSLKPRNGVHLPPQVQRRKPPRVEWIKPEHPHTATSHKSDVHTNHNEANNSALRRRSSAFRRRQNLYPKNTEGLQRIATLRRLTHNSVRPHVGLGKNKTPAIETGLFYRPVSMMELLSSRGFHCLTKLTDQCLLRSLKWRLPVFNALPNCVE